MYVYALGVISVRLSPLLRAYIVCAIICTTTRAQYSEISSEFSYLLGLFACKITAQFIIRTQSGGGTPLCRHV